MKKYLYILTALLLGAVSCSVEGPAVPDVKENDGTVDFIMKVTLPEPIEATKGAMDDQPIIDNLYVAVFGGEGYLNDYTRAVRCDADGTNIRQDWSGITNGSSFYFKVTLTATQSLRHVHVIANGPAQLDFNTYENELMQHMTTTGTNGAYWQYFELPHGTVKADGVTPSDEAAAAFNNIKLIRNFAKVSVSVAESVTNFTITGFKVFNIATGGSVAIWNSKSEKYMSDYSSYSTIESLMTDYPNGFVPTEITYDKTAPADDNTYTAEDKYYYERPGGQQDGPYIIIKGKYGSHNYDTYYRLDFVNRDGDYLPLYRNFEYKIVLTSVAKEGPTSPVGLKASNSNVSSLIEFENLSDLSDGVSRIYVMWLDQTYMEAQQNVPFKYMYLKKADTDTQSSNAIFSFISGEGEAITAGNGWSTGGGTAVDAQGWKTVYFNVMEPDVDDPETGYKAKEKITKFRVTGETDDHQKLYRNITIHVLPPQQFGTATVTSAGAAIGSKVTVTIPLPSGLPSSVFPLEIMFEDSNHRLNPYSTDMPVNIGDTIIPNKSGTSFQFKKSISYKEYTETAGGSFSFEFKRIATGATALYYTSEFFKTTGNSVTIPAN